MSQPQSEDWAATFGSPAGQKVLKHLQESFWMFDPMYQPGIPKLDVIYREGQRSVVIMLTEAVQAALLTTPDEVPDSYAPEQPQEETYNA